MPKLSIAQDRALRLIAAGRSPATGISGMSAHGGLSGTITSLHRRGLLNSTGSLTEAGRAALVPRDRRG